MSRVIINCALILVLALVGYQVFTLYRQKRDLQKEEMQLMAQVDEVNGENVHLQGDITYYQQPKNLEKELRARFNYAAPGETMIIIIPKKP